MGLILNYLTGAPYLLMAVASAVVADGVDVGAAVQVDRADLRPARPADDRVRRGAGRDPSAVGQDRGRVRAAGAERPQHQGAAELRLFRRRDPQRRACSPTKPISIRRAGSRRNGAPKDLAHQPRHQHRRHGPRLVAGDHRSSPARRSCSDPPMSARKSPAAPRWRRRSRSARPGCCSRCSECCSRSPARRSKPAWPTLIRSSQFFGWEWGRHKKPWEAPRFTIAWIACSSLALADRADRRRCR